MRYAIVLAFVLSLGLADEGKSSVRDDATRAADLYDKGEKRAAAELFQKLATRILAEDAGALGGFVPAAPKDVQRSEPKVDSGTFGHGEQSHQWSQVRTKYTWPDKNVVDLTISTNNQMVQAHEAMVKMYKNPQYRQAMQMNPNIKVDFEEKGPWVFLTHAQQGRKAQFTAVCKDGTVSASTRSGDTSKFSFIKDSIAWDDLAKAMGRG